MLRGHSRIALRGRGGGWLVAERYNFFLERRGGQDCVTRHPFLQLVTSYFP